MWPTARHWPDPVGPCIKECALEQLASVYFYVPQKSEWGIHWAGFNTGKRVMGLLTGLLAPSCIFNPRSEMNAEFRKHTSTKKYVNIMMLRMFELVVLLC